MNILDDKNKQRITTEYQLRKVISHYPKMLDKRILPELDKYCLEYIALSRLVITAFSQTDRPMTPLTVKDLVIADRQTILLPRDILPPSKTHITFVSLYFLIPGIGHGLRVNGQMLADQKQPTIRVKSAYLHCARAAARAQIWHPSQPHSAPEPSQLTTPADFLAHNSYLLIKTMNAFGETELSPKGDQAGFVHRIDSSSLFIPERPGNKVAISLRNILKNHYVELLMFIPGTDLIMHVSGKAVITTDSQLLALAAIENKRPKLGICLIDCTFTITHSATIQSVKPWATDHHISPNQLTKFSQALSAQMNGEGLFGKTTAPIINAIVKHDMRHLY